MYEDFFISLRFQNGGQFVGLFHSYWLRAKSRVHGTTTTQFKFKRFNLELISLKVDTWIGLLDSKYAVDQAYKFELMNE